MAIMRWRPTWDQNDIEKFFEQISGVQGMRDSYTPAVDVYEDKDNVIVETPLAGVDPAKVNVTIENDVLKIEGHSEHKSEVDEDNYYRKEVRYGSFNRAVALPAHVISAKAEAQFENGLLKVIIPKVKNVKPKSIKIEVKKSNKK